MGAARRRRQALGDAYGASPALVWHYTAGRKIPRILRDGCLRCAWHGAAAFPAVWFTTAPEPDPTSCVALSLRNFYRSDHATFKRLMGGFWRISLPADHHQLRTYGWALETYPPSSTEGRYIRTLDRAGENRNDWRLALDPVPITGCSIEELVGNDWVIRSQETLSLDPAGPGYGVPGQEIEVPDDKRAIAMARQVATLQSITTALAA